MASSDDDTESNYDLIEEAMNTEGDGDNQF